MFKEMRRTDRAISAEMIYETLKTGMEGVFVTSGENGYPTATPFNYVVIDKDIYVHCFGKSSNTKDNVQFNEKASFTYVGDTKLLPDEFVCNYISIMAFGTAKIIESEEKREVLREFIRKYSPLILEKGFAHVDEEIGKTVVIKLNVEYITGKQRK
ncbi:MAG: pyridoxamine 5'-phosphate oxidase family protein [Lachnospiraceae bacterium]